MLHQLKRPQIASRFWNDNDTFIDHVGMNGWWGDISGDRLPLLQRSITPTSFLIKFRIIFAYIICVNSNSFVRYYWPRMRLSILDRRLHFQRKMHLHALHLRLCIWRDVLLPLVQICCLILIIFLWPLSLLKDIDISYTHWQ